MKKPNCRGILKQKFLLQFRLSLKNALIDDKYICIILPFLISDENVPSQTKPLDRKNLILMLPIGWRVIPPAKNSTSFSLLGIKSEGKLAIATNGPV